MNHISRVRQAVDRLNDDLTDLLDVAGVPDDSETSLAATRAVSSIYDVLEQVPRCGRTANLVFHEGPLFYVDPRKDMREWRTSEGKPAYSSSRAAALSKARKVMARGPLRLRRVVTAEIYESELAQIEAEQEPLLAEIAS